MVRPEGCGSDSGVDFLASRMATPVPNSGNMSHPWAPSPARQTPNSPAFIADFDDKWRVFTHFPMDAHWRRHGFLRNAMPKSRCNDHAETHHLFAKVNKVIVNTDLSWQYSSIGMLGLRCWGVICAPLIG